MLLIVMPLMSRVAILLIGSEHVNALRYCNARVSKDCTELLGLVKRVFHPIMKCIVSILSSISSSFFTFSLFFLLQIAVEQIRISNPAKI